jgi:hypothetical protein
MRSELTALKDCDPPFTWAMARVLPCVGRTLPVESGIQSIWFLKTPVWEYGLSSVSRTGGA